MLAAHAEVVDRSLLEQRLEREIALRTFGRVHGLRVDVGEDRVTVHGFTSSYYAKQLAIQAVMNLFEGTDSPPAIEIEVRGTMSRA
jgi:hypothetical protein